MPAGRPTDYTVEMATFICSEIASGEKITDICLAESMPSPRAIYAWLAKYPEFQQQYARAQLDRTHAMAEEVLEIADESGFDAHIVDGRAVVNGDAIQRARLRVDTRKWLMSKMAPKKYGDKLELGTPAEGFKVVGRIENVIVDPYPANPDSESV